MLNDAIFIVGDTAYDLRELFNCWVRRIQISSPKRRKTTVKVPYRNGELELKLSDSPVFNNRTLTFYMTLVCDEPISTFEQIAAMLHGQKVKVIINQSDFYYDGEAEVTQLKANSGKWQFQINVNAYPYQLRYFETVKTVQATAVGKELYINNDYMPVIPSFETENGTETTIELNGKSYTYSGAGEHKSVSIRLNAGGQTLTVKGTDKVTIKFREGRL